VLPFEVLQCAAQHVPPRQVLICLSQRVPALLRAVGCYSLFPLLFGAEEYPIKVCAGPTVLLLLLLLLLLLPLPPLAC
jgi:hypothetical protein